MAFTLGCYIQLLRFYALVCLVAYLQQTGGHKLWRNKKHLCIRLLHKHVPTYRQGVSAREVSRDEGRVGKSSYFLIFTHMTNGHSIPKNIQIYGLSRRVLMSKWRWSGRIYSSSFPLKKQLSVVQLEAVVICITNKSISSKTKLFPLTLYHF